MVVAGQTVTKVPVSGELHIVNPPKSSPAAHPISTFTYVILPTKAHNAPGAAEDGLLGTDPGAGQQVHRPALVRPDPRARARLLREALTRITAKLIGPNRIRFVEGRRQAPLSFASHSSLPTRVRRGPDRSRRSRRRRWRRPRPPRLIASTRPRAAPSHTRRTSASPSRWASTSARPSRFDRDERGRGDGRRSSRRTGCQTVTGLLRGAAAPDASAGRGRV